MLVKEVYTIERDLMDKKKKKNLFQLIALKHASRA